MVQIELAQQIAKELQDDALAQRPVDNLDALRLQVADVVQQHIENNMERLLQMLYIMDISEEKIKKTLVSHSEEATPLLLADLIIEREMQKMQTRQAYRLQHQHLQEEIQDDEELKEELW